MRDKFFPQRAAEAPNYQAVWFKSKEAAGPSTDLADILRLRSKLIHARFSISRAS